jgi:serine/threonine protein kinase/tetratricopeptide (TPR) repeat protein
MVEDISSAAMVGRGATIGRYLVLDMIGKGGMGEVYAAYDPELDRKVAIKVLRTSSSAAADPAEGRARILREAQALAQLSDPNVVAVYDVGTFGERVFLAMEFVDGSTLNFWQQAQVRSWREIVEMYAQAGRGLAAAHRRGLVHRDFKPENAMVGRDGHVRVMDFGLARSEAQVVVPDASDEARRISSGIGRTPSQIAAIVSGRASGATSPAGHADGQTARDARSAPNTLVSDLVPLLATGSPLVSSAASAALDTSRASPVPPSGVVAISVSGDPDWSSQTRDLAKPAILDRSPGHPPNALASPLTQSGAMMGTPAYMAPEQFAGKVADAKSDQFAFCVALYEGLYGERPFGAKNLPELTRQVMSGRVREAPAGSHIPGWLRRVILRGLRVEREERHASMAALLLALSRDPARRRRRYAAVAGVAGLIAALTGGLVEMSQRQKMKCLGADAKLAGIWELPGRPGAPLSARKQAIRTAFMSSGKRYANEAFALVQSTLDRYVGAWNDMHRDACEATHVRGEQSAEVLDLRMICLQDRFNEIRALTAVFTEANGDVVSKSAEAVQSLRSVQQCGDIATLKAVVRPPDDPEVRRAVADVRAALAEVKAEREAGRLKQAAEHVRHVLADARKTGYEPIVAESSLESAQVSGLQEDEVASGRQYEDALWSAESSRHEEVAVLAAAQLVYTAGYREGRFTEAERWSRMASAILRRLGAGHDLAAGWLANNRALLYQREGELDRALASALEAIEIKKRALGNDHLDVALSEGNAAQILFSLNRVDEALARNETAVRIVRSALGPDHPTVAFLLRSTADIMNAKHRYQEARMAAEKALDIGLREMSPQSPFIAFALVPLGESLLGLNRPAEAVVVLKRAIAMLEGKEDDPALLGEAKFALARALSESQRPSAQSRGLAHEAAVLLRRTPGQARMALQAEELAQRGAGDAHRVSMR